MYAHDGTLLDIVMICGAHPLYWVQVLIFWAGLRFQSTHKQTHLHSKTELVLPEIRGARGEHAETEKQSCEK